MITSAQFFHHPETFRTQSGESLPGAAVTGDADLDVYSENSPLGAAILGLEPGDTTTFTAPSGAEIAVEIISIEPFVG